MTAATWLPEQFVSDPATGNQVSSEKAVAIAPDGSGIVAYSGLGASDRRGIFFRPLDEDGTAVGEAVRVNQTVPGVQRHAVTSRLADGRFLIVWNGQGEQSDHGVFARMIGRDGNFESAELRVDSDRAGIPFRPSVAALKDGGFVVTWTNRTRTSDLFARRFDSTGRATGEEVRINQRRQVEPDFAVVAATPDGGFAVAWQGRKYGPGNDIYLNRFDASGFPLSAREFRVNQTRLGRQVYPDVASLADGQLLITWSGRGEDDRSGIYARTLGEDGLATTDEVLVNQDKTGSSLGPKIAAGADGSFLVLWTHIRPRDRQMTVKGRHFETLLSPTSDEFVVPESSSRVDAFPSLTADADGGYLTAWTRRQDGQADVYTRRFSSTIGQDDTAPIVTFGLTDDSGSSDLDAVTNDLSIAGSVTDESEIVRLTLEFESSQSSVIDLTDRLDASGLFVIDHQSMIDAIGSSVSDGPVTLRVTATDSFGNVSAPAILNVALDRTPPQPIAFDRIRPDSGRSDSDGVTNQPATSAFGTAEPTSIVHLLDDAGAVLTNVITNEQGEWTATLPILDEGTHAFSVIAIDLAGNESASASRTIHIDTVSPELLDWGISPDSDSGITGDGRTDAVLVDVVGRSEPGATVSVLGGLRTHSSTVQSDGRFRVTSDSLLPGQRDYTVVVEDLAGNVVSEILPIYYEANLDIDESIFDSRSSLVLPVPAEFHAPKVKFGLETLFDRSAIGAASEDIFSVSVFDPDAPGLPLLTRQSGMPSLLTVAGDQIEYDPSLVRFDGQNVEIDLSSIQAEEVELSAQWINVDEDFGSTARLTRIVIDNSFDAFSSPGFDDSVTTAPIGPAVDLDQYTPDPTVSTNISEVHLDPLSGRIEAKLTVSTGQQPTGRRLVVSFPNLGPNVQVIGPSGTDSSGVPYLNLIHAVSSGGLASGARSSSVDLVIDNPDFRSLVLRPLVSSVGDNTPPTLTDPGPLSVEVGGHLRVDLSAQDVDGDLLRYFIRSDGGLPNAELTADGQLIVTPAPGQEGDFRFELGASDGSETSTLALSLLVASDPIASTRISGSVLDIDGQPLAGIPVEFGADVTTTRVDGSFELEVSPDTNADALFIRGEAFQGAKVYPFIAEKIPLLLGRDLYSGFRNVIDRPIYLPALDIANGMTVDPTQDTTVTTAAIPGAAVLVKAGSLSDQNGQPFSGVLSITEVPAEFTPAALPQGLYTDLVVTIQPGEMVFETPAPLTLPNRAGHAPGTEMILWSISPITGDFVNVGTGRVSGDGALVETISGGIRNSSWHDFSTTEPIGTPPEEDDNNPDKECDDCESRHQPQGSGSNFNPIDIHTGISGSFPPRLRAARPVRQLRGNARILSRSRQVDPMASLPGPAAVLRPKTARSVTTSTRCRRRPASTPRTRSIVLRPPAVM